MQESGSGKKREETEEFYVQEEIGERIFLFYLSE